MNIKPVILYPKRNMVDLVNKTEFDKLTGDIYKFCYNVKIMKNDKGNNYENYIQMISKEQIEYEVDYLCNNIIREIDLKVGCQVMCTVNMDMEHEKPMCNGSQGHIISFQDGYPFVEFNNGRRILVNKYPYTSEKYPFLVIEQVPLMLSWAITIHKCQGMTLDKAIINIGCDIFECGQTYVALSRLQSINGLYLEDFDYSRIKVNKKVIEFYDNLKKQLKN